MAEQQWPTYEIATLRDVSDAVTPENCERLLAGFADWLELCIGLKALGVPCESYTWYDDGRNDVFLVDADGQRFAVPTSATKLEAL